ncbi:MAG TPA: hypothetical protein VF611_04315, partial [Pyrinomonadaceae bacterium]
EVSASKDGATKGLPVAGSCCAPVEIAAGSCCAPAETAAAAASVSCCGPAAGAELHGDLRDLLERYDVNDYAASVKVFAVKPRT